jgi:uncharacterized protein (DUF736 family)
MATIGTFVPTKDGGWTGHIRTLMIDVKVRLVPNDNKENEAAPAFRVFAGDAEIGAAWRKRSGGDEPKDYLSVKLDDPALPDWISAAMFEASDGNELRLVWNRRPPM